MKQEQAQMAKAVAVAAVVGVVAAGIAYLLYARPRWRAQIIEATHLALDVVGGIVKHGDSA